MPNWVEKEVRAIAQLKKLAKSWGGALVGMKAAQYKLVEHRGTLNRHEFSHAPFMNEMTIGVVHKSKKILYNAENREVSPAAMIHEMGHVFACKYEPDSAQCAEFNFFGWEYLLAKKVGVAEEWCEANKDYIVDNNDNAFGDLSPKKQQAVLKKAIATAQACGLVVGVTPGSIRKEYK